MHLQTRGDLSRPTRRAATVPVAASLLALLVLGGCTKPGGSGSSGGRSVVLASNSIWADIVRNLVCDSAVQVRSIVPPGVDAHSFELTLKDQAEIDGAAAVVLNGLGLDDPLAKAVESVGSDGPRMIVAGEAAHEAIEAREGGAAAGEEEHADVDPHVWMDPTAVSAAINPIIAGLAEGLGRKVATFQPCADQYRLELQKLNARLAAQMKKVPTAQRDLVTNHDNLGYFAQAYGLGIAGTVLPSNSTLASATPQALAALGEVIRSTKVRAIFVDTGISDVDARALAQSVGGVKVVTMYTDTLSPKGGDASSYLELMTQIGDAIAAGLADK